MFSIMFMSGRFLAMKTVDNLDDFHFDEKELERNQTFIDEGTPVTFCEDLENFTNLLNELGLPEDIEIIEPK